MKKNNNNCAKPSSARLIVPAVLTVSIALAGCQTGARKRASLFNSPSSSDITGSIKRPNNVVLATTKLATQWQKNRGDAKIGLNYARHLNAIGSIQPALRIIRQTALKNPQNQQVIVAYGKQLSKVGQFSEAHKILQKSHSLGRADWRIHSAQGTVLDKMKQHKRARISYRHALKLAPGHPAVINNMAMSFALSGDLKQAETHLRQAVKRPGASPKIRQNLALVVGLQGRFKESEKIASTDLPAETVTQNTQYLRQMLSQPNNWNALRKAGKS